MAIKLGVDISYHNGDIDFKTLSKNVEFIIIRAGYGQGNIDKKLFEYVSGCNQYNIPYGFYWFSYATNEERGIREAKYFIDAIKTFKPIYPCFFDFEDDSHKGILSYQEIANIANGFIRTMNASGYTCGIYCDNEYYNGYAKAFSCKVPIWYARWGSKLTPPECDIYQYTDKGIVDGIKTKVDMNNCYKEYGQTEKTNTKTIEELLKCYHENDVKYTNIALKIINGEYGNGEARKKRLYEENIDAKYAQNLVNILVKYGVKPEG